MCLEIIIWICLMQIPASWYAMNFHFREIIRQFVFLANDILSVIRIKNALAKIGIALYGIWAAVSWLISKESKKSVFWRQLSCCPRWYKLCVCFGILSWCHHRVMGISIIYFGILNLRWQIDDVLETTHLAFPIFLESFAKEPNPSA